jgi:hypothetical protein
MFQHALKEEDINDLYRMNSQTREELLGRDFIFALDPRAPNRFYSTSNEIDSEAYCPPKLLNGSIQLISQSITDSLYTAGGFEVIFFDFYLKTYRIIC